MGEKYAKLTPKEVKFFYEIEEKINTLYEAKKKALSKIIEKKGPSEGYIKVDNTDRPYIRVTIKDYLKEIKEGNTLYRNTAFNRYSADISHLKNEPK